jgi:hypothetical protein
VTISFSIPVQIASSILAAILVAMLALSGVLRRHPPHIQNGCWEGQLDLPLGGGLLRLYQRAFIAAHGIFMLRSPETIYFGTPVDCAGKKLRCGATYCIRGRDPDARWWSLTAYKHDHLIPNVLNRYSFSKTTISRSADGSWKIYISPRHQPENWLPTGEPSGHFTVLLRLYNPGSEALSNPGKIQLPEIVELEEAP